MDNDGTTVVTPGSATSTVTLRLRPEVREEAAQVASRYGTGEAAVVLAALLATRFRHSRRENAEVLLPSDRPRAFGLEVLGEQSFADLLRGVDHGLAGSRAGGPADGAATPDTVEQVVFQHGRPLPMSADGRVLCTVETDGAELTGLLEWGSLPAGVTAEECTARLLTLLADAVRRPEARIDELAVLPEARQLELAAAANAAFEDYQGLLPLHEAFEATVRSHPTAVAVEAGGRATTFAELDGRANLLAHVLADAGIGAGSLVAVCVERSADLVVALLAVLKRGAAFVPLEPALPVERVSVIARDARVAAVIAQDSQADRLDGIGAAVIRVPAEGTASQAPAAAVSLDHAAYVYYTSGSTGTPKGVVIDHRCAAGRLEWLGRRYGLVPGDRVIHKTPLIFDVAIWELFGPLSAGATILMADPGAESDVVHLSRLLATERTVFAHFVPSMLNAYLNLAPEVACPDLRWVQLSGEAAGAGLLERFSDRFDAELHNLYGQTETSEVAGWEGRTFDGHGGLPIGSQIGIYRLFVLDEALRPVPPGVPGELCVSGVGGLAQGYLGRPALTAERFVPHPYPVSPGERLYRTGDLVDVDADGRIRYLGRVDGQVKIRGCRVETGEVEAVLGGHGGVRECAVAVFQDESGDNQIAAYVVGDGWDAEALAAHAERYLPGYMLPAVYVALDALPHTPSGKLDRLRLPAPSVEDRQARTRGEAPLNPLEEQVAALWCQVLGVERVGRGDSFFAIGGNSLKSLQLLNRVNATFGIQVSVRDFFAMPTVEGVADSVEEALTALVGGLSEEEAEALLGSL
ncbi:non-ribosomal peptide synthetase [Kitasatospora brasiliensis]|uniref:non-ribosomal peptide synthetase n=1 Tax=Kitasatospora brasiliensis TaxID=3058040 RepID=UPI00292D754D|nr:non-ribosomal peptide synthetase [Kitasatospora sp. K002]